MKRPIPTQDELNHLFRHDRETGVLFWKNPRSPTKSPGDTAGCVSRMAHNRYVIVNIRKTLYLAHRIVWVMHYGTLADDAILDHINNDGTDNRIENLRIADRRLNAMNSKIRVDNTSGFRGVTFDKSRGKWSAVIHVNGKNIYLGRFERVEDAAAARRDAEGRYPCHC